MNIPVLRPRRASVRIWSTVRRTRASMPPTWMTPSSFVNELVMSCLDDMRFIPSLGFLESRELRFARGGRLHLLLDRPLLDAGERVLVGDEQHAVVAAGGLRVLSI